MSPAAAWVLVLIYYPFVISTEPTIDEAKCLTEARSRIGEKLPVPAWDDMGGSNPIPYVVAAFCARGATE
jgi:hypothetical protein